MFILLFSSINLVSAENITINNYVSSLDIVRGNLLQGTKEDLNVFNSDYLVIQELNETNPLQVNINTILDGTPKELRVNAYYEGGASHDVELQVFDNNLNAWLVLKTYGNANNFVFDVIDLSGYNLGGNAEFRFLHIQDGIETHNLNIDYFMITTEKEDTTSSFDLFNIDFSETSELIIFILFVLISGFLAISFTYPLSDLGSFGLLLSGFLGLFNNVNIVISVFIIFVGIIFIFRD